MDLFVFRVEAMRKRKAGRKFGRKRGVRRAFLRSLISALLVHGRIKTTEARGKELRSHAERAITMGKQENNLAARRNLRAFLPEIAVRKVINDLAPRFRMRKGGYTRMRKLSTPRKDGAPQVFIELLKE